MKREPVKYNVLEKSLIGNALYEAGSVAEYDGLPADNLAPTCDVGRARYQEYLQTNAERVARMKADNAQTPIDLEALAKLMVELMGAKGKK